MIFHHSSEDQRPHWQTNCIESSVIGVLKRLKLYKLIRCALHRKLDIKDLDLSGCAGFSTRRDYHNLMHYRDVIMSLMASHISSLTIVYPTVYSGADQMKHQSSASLAFVWGIHRSPVNSPHKWPVMRKLFPFDDVIMWLLAVPSALRANAQSDCLDSECGCRIPL